MPTLTPFAALMACSRQLNITTGLQYLSQFATDRETLTPQWPKYKDLRLA